MRIRFTQAATARLAFRAGDELVVSRLTPELQTLLSSQRLDGAHVAVCVDEDETAVAATERDEFAVPRQRRSSAKRSTSIPREHDRLPGERP